MRRLIAVAVIIFLVLVVGEIPSFGISNVGFVKLYEQDSLGRMNEKGAWGTLKFNLVGPSFEFTFNGERFAPNINYTLICSREPEIKVPNRFEAIASGTADKYGNLHIAGLYQFNMSLISANILLLPTAEAVPDKPLKYLSKYLFGVAPISYEDTTTDLKCGDNQSPGPPVPGEPNWDALGLQIGDKAVDFTLFGIESPESLTDGNKPQPLQEFTLSDLLLDKPVVLTFGAFT
jgi:hypothetical protein